MAMQLPQPSARRPRYSLDTSRISNSVPARVLSSTFGSDKRSPRVALASSRGPASAAPPRWLADLQPVRRSGVIAAGQPQPVPLSASAGPLLISNHPGPVVADTISTGLPRRTTLSPLPSRCRSPLLSSRQTSPMLTTRRDLLGDATPATPQLSGTSWLLPQMSAVRPQPTPLPSTLALTPSHPPALWGTNISISVPVPAPLPVERKKSTAEERVLGDYLTAVSSGAVHRRYSGQQSARPRSLEAVPREKEVDIWRSRVLAPAAEQLHHGPLLRTSSSLQFLGSSSPQSPPAAVRPSLTKDASCTDFAHQTTEKASSIKDTAPEDFKEATEEAVVEKDEALVEKEEALHQPVGLGPAAVVSTPSWEDHYRAPAPIVAGLGRADSLLASACQERPPRAHPREDLFETCQALMKLLCSEDRNDKKEPSFSPPTSVRINPPPGFVPREEMLRSEAASCGSPGELDTSCGSSAMDTTDDSPADIQKSISSSSASSSTAEAAACASTEQTTPQGHSTRTQSPKKKMRQHVSHKILPNKANLAAAYSSEQKVQPSKAEAGKRRPSPIRPNRRSTSASRPTLLGRVQPMPHY